MTLALDPSYLENRKAFWRRYEAPFERMAFVGSAISIWGLRVGFETVGALSLASVAFAVGAIPACVWAFRMARANVQFIGGLMGPKKRIVRYSFTVALAVGMLSSNVALLSNRYIAFGSEFVLSATVLRTGQVVGPKLWGWDTEFQLSDGRTHYMMVSREDYDSFRCGSSIEVKLKNGLLGFPHIVGVRRGPCA